MCLEQTEQTIRCLRDPHAEGQIEQKRKIIWYFRTLTQGLPTLTGEQIRHIQQNLHSNHKLHPSSRIKRNQAQVTKNEASRRKKYNNSSLNSQQCQHKLKQPSHAEQPRQEGFASPKEHQDPLNLFAFYNPKNLYLNYF